MEGTGQSHCSARADVIINHAGFHPLLPREYANLVPVCIIAARNVEAIVHDGVAFVERAKLRDRMICAEEPTEAVADMYFEAVGDMNASARHHEAAAQPPQNVTAQVSMAAAAGDESDRMSEQSADESAPTYRGLD